MSIFGEAKKGFKRIGKYLSGGYAEEDRNRANRALDMQEKNLNQGLALAKENDDRNYKLASDWFDWQKGIAADADAERKTQSDLMLQEATLTPEEINNATGVAASTVGSSFDRAEQDRARGLTRMGVNPGSGRSLSDSRMLSLSKAAAVADATNTTRSNLTSLSKQRKDNARLVRIGLQPLELGVPDKRIGLSSAALPMYGAGMNMYGNNANSLLNSSNQGLSGMVGFYGDVIGAGGQVAGRTAGGLSMAAGGK